MRSVRDGVEAKSFGVDQNSQRERDRRSASRAPVRARLLATSFRHAAARENFLTLAQQADSFAYFLSILMQYRELAAVGGDLTICHLCARRGRTSKRIGSIRKSANIEFRAA